MLIFPTFRARPFRKKKDYFIRSCIYNHICVVGKKETIYPLVQTINALYLQLLEMQKKAFTSTGATPDILPSAEAIRCKKYNSAVIFDDPNDIVYLYRLAEETPLTYAKLALQENGLQDYMDAMNESN